ncbi:HAMP domain-containing protein [Dactylosporangium aurantiacum]|uniref:histidine kinase n=1 Tax=Dactylosporangium aurantiacum TaxID=35754 RepID=A0A9Q9I823_9ACTN|nr:ATP-binding protein [Dactylosporangium aurantiacum]MDG6106719.1 ATP-binding protein [Dactylosporangium aurantiacum]UWZ50866.1 HAMP domain-containing protein [Dactylosporangium aurantiacum]
MRHPSIRLRLTVVYAVVLVVACAALLALNYWLLYHSLYDNIHDPSPAELAKLRAAPPGMVPEAGEKLRAAELDAALVARLRRQTLLSTAGTSAIGLLVTAVIGLGISWVVAGRMLRPLRTLTATTRRISEDRLHERIALTGPRDELRELADTFDEMVGRLESAFTSQRRFVADAAHELRTPLAIVRTGAEVQLAKRHSSPEQWQAMAERVLVATGRAERMLDGLLALARSDSGVIAAEPHDLAPAAAAALGDIDDEVERAGLSVTTDLRPAPVTGDPALLDRLVSNLVDNAVRHNQTGGRVEVTTAGAAGSAVLVVRNTGERIPPAEVSRLFEPFQRLAPERAAGARSTGLGLAIVRSIVHAHDGTVTASPNPDGGLTVTVTLPAPG